MLHLGCGGRAHPAWLNADLGASPGVIAVDVRSPLPFDDGVFDAVYHAHLLEHLTPDEGETLIAECVRVLRPGGVLRVTVPDLAGIAREYLAQHDAALAGDSVAAERRDWMALELIDQMVRTTPGGRMLRHWARDLVPEEGFVRSRFGEEFDLARGVIIDHIRRTGSPPPWAVSHPDAKDAAQEAAFRERGEAHRWMYDRVSLAALFARRGVPGAGAVAPGESAIEGWAGYHLELDEQRRARKPDSVAVEGVKPAAAGGA